MLLEHISILMKMLLRIGCQKDPEEIAGGSVFHIKKYYIATLLSKEAQQIH